MRTTIMPAGNLTPGMRTHGHYITHVSRYGSVVALYSLDGTRAICDIADLLPVTDVAAPWLCAGPCGSFPCTCDAPQAQ